MPDRLTRWQWARRHTTFGWREIVGAALVGAIYLALSQHYGWGQEVKPEIGAVVAAVLGATLLYVAEFGWRFARAGIVQDREDLAAALADLAAARAELEAVVSLQPAIETKVERDGQDWFVVVRNLGANGDFQAQIRIHSADCFPTASAGACYRGYWERAGGAEARILSRFQDRIRLGGIRHERRPILETSLALYFAGAYQAPSEIHQDWLVEVTPPPPKPALFLEITVSSEPAMRETFVRAYALNLDGLSEWPHALA